METAVARPLSQTDQGQVVSVTNIVAGRGLKMRLASMGLIPKTKIQVLRNGKSGPVVISVKNTRVALGRGVAEKIIVT